MKEVERAYVRILNMGRILIPSQYRNLFEKEGISLNKLVIFLSRDEEGNYISAVPDTLYKETKTLRRSRGTIYTFNVKEGRVTIPKKLRKAASIDDKVEIMKIGKYMEIWNPKRLGEHTNKEIPEKKLYNIIKYFITQQLPIKELQKGVTAYTTQ